MIVTVTEVIDGASVESSGVTVNVTEGGVGADGQSAYEIAVANGFSGTEAEWLTSLHGEDGAGVVATVVAPLVLTGDELSVDVGVTGGVADHDATTTALAGKASTATTDALDGRLDTLEAVDNATQAELDAHAADTTSVHGIADTTALVLTNDSRLTDDRDPTAHAASHQDGGTDELALDGSQITTGTVADARIASTIARDSEVTAAVAAHEADTTSVHGIADTSVLATATSVATAVSNHAAAADPHTGYLKESDYDANTILAATTDNTPVALTVAASRIVGRKASGDIAAMTASEAKTVLGITGADVAFTPAGTIAATTVQAAIEEVASEASGGGGTVLGYAAITSDVTGIGASSTDITGLSVTFTAGTNRLIRVTAFVRFLGSTTNMTATLLIVEGATSLSQGSYSMPLSTAAYAAPLPALLVSPSAGSHTYKVAAARASASGTISVDVDAVVPGFLLVEDLGPA